MESSEEDGAYIFPPISTSRLIFLQGAFLFLFFLDMLTNPIISQIWIFVSSHFFTQSDYMCCGYHWPTFTKMRISSPIKSLLSVFWYWETTWKFVIIYVTQCLLKHIFWHHFSFYLLIFICTETDVIICWIFRSTNLKLPTNHMLTKSFWKIRERPEIK